MNETGGSLEDYVKLKHDYALLNENQLLREYYENTKPHLDTEEIDFLWKINFLMMKKLMRKETYVEKDCRKEELAKAKNHLDGLKV